jgi:hypothetical protein
MREAKGSGWREYARALFLDVGYESERELRCSAEAWYKFTCVIICCTFYGSKRFQTRGRELGEAAIRLMSSVSRLEWVLWSSRV